MKPSLPLSEGVEDEEEEEEDEKMAENDCVCVVRVCDCVCGGGGVSLPKAEDGADSREGDIDLRCWLCWFSCLEARGRGGEGSGTEGRKKALPELDPAEPNPSFCEPLPRLLLEKSFPVKSPNTDFVSV